MQFPKFVLRTCGSALPLALVVALLGLGANPAVAQGVGPSGCVAGCDSPSPTYTPPPTPTYTPPPDVPSRPSPAELEAERQRVQRQRMLDTNDRGLRFYKQEEYELAIQAFREALGLCQREDDCEVIGRNIADVQSWIDYKNAEAERQRQAAAEEAERQRQVEAEEAERQRQREQAKQTIGGMLDDLASQWGAPAPSGGSGSLDFAGPGGTAVAAAPLEFVAPGGQSAPDALEFVAPGDSSVEDLEVATGEAFEPVAPKALKFPLVPSPKGYKSADERRAMAGALSDKALAVAITRTDAVLRRMQKDFGADKAALKEALADAEQAEEDALLASLELVLAVGLDKDVFPVKGPKTRDLRFALERAKTTAEQLKSLNKPPLEKARAVMLDVIDQFGNLPENAAKRVARVAALASFVADYGLASTRWAFAWNRTRAIVDNLDAPNGKLKAQEALARLQKDLIDERKRRQGR